MGRDPILHSPDADRLSSLVEDRLDGARRDNVRTAPDKQQLGQQVAEAAIGELRSGVEQRGVAHLCLTGGSMGSEVVRALAQNSAGEPFWSSVHLWWGDERFVPVGDPDRNDQQADDAGLLRLGVPAGSVHRLPGASSTTTDALSELALASEEYATQLAAAATPATDSDRPAVPMFDVMLLGLGPDTHVASLFPGRHEVAITDPRQSTVPVASSPKPPPLRVSLTVPALRQSRTVHFVVAGADKAEAVSTALSAPRNSPDVPASYVAGQVETTWWLDQAAAAGLPSRGA